MHPLVATVTWLTFWVGAASAAFAGVPVALVIARYLWRAVVKGVAREVSEINRKVTPNGGWSGNLGDRVARIESAVAELVAAKREAQG